MELTMSMFATQADYWRARSGLHEGTVTAVAMEIGCVADNEVLLAEIAALKKAADRYRWLRENPTWIGYDSDYRADEVDAVIDAVIDAAMKPPNAQVQRDSGGIIAGGSAGTTG